MNCECLARSFFVEEFKEMSDNKKGLYVETKINNKNMYEFMLNHTYRSMLGIVGVLISVLAIVALVVYGKNYDITKKLMFIFVALLFTVVNPISLYFKSKRQVKMNDSFNHPLCYTFSEDGIEVRQGEQSLNINWDDVIKVISSKNLVVIYISAINAFIFPKEQIKENFEEFKKLITDNCKARKVSVK